MHDITARAITEDSTSGLFNYLDEAVHPSLFRNGEVLTKRDADGGDSGTVGMSLAETELMVYNARALGGYERRTCQANGFELLSVPLKDDDIDFFDHDIVVRHYYAQCAQLVAEHLGARAYAFDHNIRSASGKQSPSHRWFYYPKMTRAEALLIKQWDSAGVLARSDGESADATDTNAPYTFSFHSAFEDPTSPLDAPDRWSIEVRCMVIYD